MSCVIIFHFISSWILSTFRIWSFALFLKWSGRNISRESLYSRDVKFARFCPFTKLTLIKLEFKCAHFKCKLSFLSFFDVTFKVNCNVVECRLKIGSKVISNNKWHTIALWFITFFILVFIYPWYYAPLLLNLAASKQPLRSTHGSALSLTSLYFSYW